MESRKEIVNILLKEFPWITKIERNTIWCKPHGVSRYEFQRLYETLQQLGYKFGLEPSGASIHFWKPRKKGLTEDVIALKNMRKYEKNG